MTTLQQARDAGQAQMNLALSAAQRRDPWFCENAYDFLCGFARAKPGAFSAEDVTDAAAKSGISTQDRRAWGGVFQRASREGIIRRSTQVFPRRYGHGTESRGWELVR